MHMTQDLKDTILWYIESQMSIEEIMSELNIEIPDILLAFEDKIDWDYFSERFNIIRTDEEGNE